MTRQIDQSRAIQHQIDQLTVRIKHLQAENRHLRRKVKENAQEGRILRQAHRDALVMLSWHFAGMRPSRRFCVEGGISIRRWAWARSLLMCARIHDGEDINLDVLPEDALRILQTTVNRMQKDGIESLRMRNFSYRGRSHSR